MTKALKNTLIASTIVGLFFAIGFTPLEGDSKNLSFKLDDAAFNNRSDIQEIQTITQDRWADDSKGSVEFSAGDWHLPKVSWLKKTLINDTYEEQTRLLRFAFAPIYSAAFYVYDGGRLLNTVKIGRDTRVGRGYSLTTENSISATIKVPAQSTYAVYVKVETIGIGYLGLFDYGLEMRPFLQKIRTFVLGAFYGGLASLILYNLILFFVSSVRIYLYYVLYQVGALIFHFCYDGLGYLFPVTGDFRLSSLILQVALISVPIYAVKFIDAFLELEQISPLWGRARRALSALGLVLIASVFFVNTGVGTLLATGYLGFAGVVLVAALGFLMARVNYYSFLVAWAGALGSVLVSTSIHLGLLKGNSFAFDITHIGILWEAIFLSMALGERLKKLEIRQEKLKDIISGKSSKTDLNELSESEYNQHFSLSKKEVTILFVDIAHFSKLAKRLGPEKTFFELSKFMNEVSRIVEDFDGKIDRSLGDGALVVFGYSKGMLDHSLNAFNAAVAIQKYSVDQAYKKAKSKEPSFSCRIGINRTVAHIGNLGNNSRMDYTVIGDGVNFASRLENSCNPFNIMVGESVKNLISQSHGNLSFSKTYIAVKHEDELFVAYQHDPFTKKREEIRSIQVKSYNYLNKSPLHPRYFTDDHNRIVLKTIKNEMEVLDYSLGGFAVQSEVLFGRSTPLLVEIRPELEESQKLISNMSLTRFQVEVRWSVRDEVNETYRIGLLIMGLSDEQKEILINALRVEEKTSLDVS